MCDDSDNYRRQCSNAQQHFIENLDISLLIIPFLN